MLVDQMKDLPTRAGDVAQLHFFSQPGEPGKKYPQPYLKGNEIFLLSCPSSEFYPLQKGRQFLFRCRVFPNNPFPNTWFGGTDEQAAFLSSLNTAGGGYSVFDVFQERGERVFYNSLRPPLLRYYEWKFRTRAQRQGDIYFLKIPDWQKYRDALSLLFGLKLRLWSVKRVPIFGTRHRLSGRRTENFAIAGRARHGEFLVGEGLLEAPNHAPRQLQGPHLIIEEDLHGIGD